MKWIKCRELKPEDGVEVLAYFPDIKDVEIATLFDKYWHNRNGAVICDPKQYPRPAVAASHWMPIPRPPIK